MITSSDKGSAKIYQFPAGGRAALGGRLFKTSKPPSNTPFCVSKNPLGEGVVYSVHPSQSRMGPLMHPQARRNETFRRFFIRTNRRLPGELGSWYLAEAGRSRTPVHMRLVLNGHESSEGLR